MKQHGSVFALFARSSVYKILLIMLVMCIAECCIFSYHFNNAVIAYNAGIGEVDMPGLEALINRSFIPQIFALFFLLITFCLCLTGTEYSAQTGYTLRRLSLSEKQIFLHQAIYNTLIYLLLAALQIFLGFALGIFYITRSPVNTVSNQTLFLAFYRSDFLHSLLPLDELALWIRNLIGGITLGLAAAKFPYLQRRRKFSSVILAYALFNMVFFVVSVGESTGIALYIIVSLWLLSEIGYTLFFKEAFDEL